jgi:hypothetical protein
MGARREALIDIGPKYKSSPPYFPLQGRLLLGGARIAACASKALEQIASPRLNSVMGTEGVKSE